MPVQWRDCQLRSRCRAFKAMHTCRRGQACGAHLIFSKARLKQVYSVGWISSSFAAVYSTAAATARPKSQQAGRHMECARPPLAHPRVGSPTGTGTL